MKSSLIHHLMASQKLLLQLINSERDRDMGDLARVASMCSEVTVILGA